jgi:hypothetical protein
VQLHYAIGVQRPDAYAPTMDGKIKAPPPAGRIWLVGWEIFGVWHTGPAGAFAGNANDSNAVTAIRGIRRARCSHDEMGR